MKRKAKYYERSTGGTLAEFLNRFITRKDKTTNSEYIPFGNNNRLPQEMLEMLGNNGVAMRAMRLRSKYIYANGFNTSFALMVNKKQNANQLLSQIAPCVSIFKAFCVQVLRTLDGSIGEVHYLPIEWVRFHPDGGFAINKTFGANKESSKWERHPAYMGKKITINQVAEMKSRFGTNAEIAYFYTKDPVSNQYPLPDWFASEFDVRTSTELMLLDNEMVVNGFMPSAIMTFPGQIDDETEDENGKTPADYRDDTIKSFTGKSRNPDTGKSGRMSVVVFDVASKEEAPIITTFDVEKIVSGSIEKRDDIDRRICHLWGMHPVLLGYSEATVLGNQQAIANASQQAALDVVSDQELITEAFGDLFDGDFSISKFTPVNYIPDKILDDLTEDERREIVGYEPKKIIQ